MSSKRQRIYFCAATSAVLITLHTISASPVIEPLVLPPEINIVPVEIITAPPIPMRGGLIEFMNDLGDRESSNRYNIVNSLGYMGRYQFGKSTLKELGSEYNVTRRMFLNTPSLQDSAFVDNLRKNQQLLSSLIDEYHGTIHKGTIITESGLLAAAHLVGPNGLRAYFDPKFTVTIGTHQIRPRISDANGVRAEEYIREFSGYDMAVLGD